MVTERLQASDKDAWGLPPRTPILIQNLKSGHSAIKSNGPCKGAAPAVQQRSVLFEDGLNKGLRLTGRFLDLDDLVVGVEVVDVPDETAAGNEFLEFFFCRGPVISYYSDNEDSFAGLFNGYVRHDQYLTSPQSYTKPD